MQTVNFGETSSLPSTLAQNLRIVLKTENLELKWSHCSNSADFISQFYAGVLAPNRTTAQIHDLSHSVAYMANELVENAVKFRAAGDVEIEAGISGDEFVLRIINWISPETSARFQSLLQEITSGDPGDLLIQKIEENVISGGSGSGLGILTLMNDYGAKISWKFQTPEDPADARVHLETVARLKVPAEQTTPISKRHHGN